MEALQVHQQDRSPLTAMGCSRAHRSLLHLPTAGCTFLHLSLARTASTTPHLLTSFACPRSAPLYRRLPITHNSSSGIFSEPSAIRLSPAGEPTPFHQASATPRHPTPTRSKERGCSSRCSSRRRSRGRVARIVIRCVRFLAFGYSGRERLQRLAKSARRSTRDAPSLLALQRTIGRAEHSICTVMFRLQLSSTRQELRRSLSCLFPFAAARESPLLPISLLSLRLLLLVSSSPSQHYKHGCCSLATTRLSSPANAVFCRAWRRAREARKLNGRISRVSRHRSFAGSEEHLYSSD